MPVFRVEKNTGYKFSIGCEQAGRLVGVAIVGRPVSRYLDDGHMWPGGAAARSCPS